MDDSIKLLAQLAALSDDEREALYKSLPEKAANEIREKYAAAKEIALASVARNHFDLAGYRAFFELQHGSTLHREGEKWAINLFLAINGRKKLLQEAFRGSGKTTAISRVFLAFWIGHHPHTTNGVIRVNGQKASETTNAVAAIIETDPVWKLVFPHIVPDKDRNWGASTGYFVKRTDMTDAEWKEVWRKTQRPDSPTFIGYGYDAGSIQGFRVNGVLLIDDIHVKENTRSARQLQDVKDFVKNQLLPIPVPEQGLEAWNFTPWLYNDAYADRKATGLYIHSRSPIMEESDDGELWPESFDDDVLDNSTYPFSGKRWKLAWPERWGFKQIATKYRDIGHMAFAREYLLDLEATRGQKLKHEWLGFYPAKDLYENGRSWPVLFGIDYASVSDKLKHKERDYFALAVWRAIPGGGMVLETGKRAQLTKPEALAEVVRMAERFPTFQLGKVEAIGKGEEFYNDLALVNDKFGRPLPLMPIRSHGKASKGDRFEDYLGPRFEARRLWISDASDDFLEHFVNEWLSYPSGEHDDCLDAAYMGAVAGEGFTPTAAERTTPGKQNDGNPFISAWSK